MNGTTVARPMNALGQFFLLILESLVATVRGPWAWRELLEQIWFVARVSIFPTIMLSIPYTVLIVFVLNILLVEIGAGDLSGAGAALASVTQGGAGVPARGVSGVGVAGGCGA